MKKFTITAQALLLSFCTLILVSCSNNKSEKSTKQEKIYSAAITGNGNKVKPSENDLRFLVDAYSLGLLKISLANEAQIRSTSAESNQLGRAVSAFHSQLNSEIEEIADEHGFTLPMDLTNDQKLVWKQLVKEKGWNFDKKFADLLEQIKQEETALFELATKNSTDKNIAVLAQKSQPELQLHETLKQTLGQKIDEKTMVAVTDEKSKEKKVKGKGTNSKSKT
jgi:predicted outer membrane protein